MLWQFCCEVSQLLGQNSAPHIGEFMLVDFRMLASHSNNSLNAESRRHAESYGAIVRGTLNSHPLWVYVHPILPVLHFVVVIYYNITNRSGRISSGVLPEISVQILAAKRALVMSTPRFGCLSTLGIRGMMCFELVVINSLNFTIVNFMHGPT